MDEHSEDRTDRELRAVLGTSRLAERASRPPDFEREAAGMSQIAAALAGKPEEILHLLAEQAASLRAGGSGGISLLEEKGEKSCFRWVAVAGALRSYIGGSAVRDLSPCGVTFSLGASQLFVRPARYFPDLVALEPAMIEVLVVPFWDQGEPLGALWVVSHGPDQPFDREDVRIMERLGSFASAALQLSRKAAEAGKEQRPARAAQAKLKRTEAALDEASDALRVSERERTGAAGALARGLQAPLEAIRLGAQALAAELSAGRSDRQSRMAHLIDAHAAWMSRVIEARTTPVVLLNCEGVFDAAARQLAGNVPAGTERVSRGGLPVIAGDAPQFAALFENLLRHGLGDGPEPPAVHLGAEPRGGLWLFLCRSSLERPPASASLPLGICEEIVASLGGKLWTEPVGRCQTVCFTVPG